MRSTVLATVLSAALVVTAGSGTATAVPGPATTSVAPAAARGLAPARITTDHFFRTMSDGVRISAYVVSPTGPGPHPVLIAPSSWSLNGLEYLGAAAGLAKDHGYVVVSYTSRGFWESGGTVQVAGPRDVADAREMIDWALTDLHGDPNRIGMFGISYGAGLSLLTASADPRVKAVAAMSGWADLERAIIPNDTVNVAAITVLTGAGLVTSRLGSELLTAVSQWLTHRDLTAFRAMAPVRSPITTIDQLNARRVPVMIANNWQDTFFAPGGVVDYYDRLTGPKRLHLVPGEHATAELPGAVAIPDTTWTAATRWLDHHVRGVANGIDPEPAVHLVDVSRPWLVGSPPESAYRAFDSWAAVTTATERRYLTATGSWTPPGRTAGLEPTPSTGWSWTVDGAVPSIADARIGADVNLILRSTGLVAQTDRFPTATRLGGTPRLHLTVASTGPATSAFATLYEVPRIGLGKPISYQAITLSAPAGTPTTVDVDLEPLHTTIAAGSRVALVVDTYDAKYFSSAKLGEKVTFSSPAGSPAYLDLPIG